MITGNVQYFWKPPELIELIIDYEAILREYRGLFCVDISCFGRGRVGYYEKETGIWEPILFHKLPDEFKVQLMLIGITE